VAQLKWLTLNINHISSHIRNKIEASQHFSNYINNVGFKQESLKKKDLCHARYEFLNKKHFKEE
jgi:hypothetical protein